MLLSDLGDRTMMSAIDADNPSANLALYLQAVDALVQWQQASRPGELPPYDEALLRRELALFPDWYLARHRGVAVEGKKGAAVEVNSETDFVARNDGFQKAVRGIAEIAVGAPGIDTAFLVLVPITVEVPAELIQRTSTV